MGRRVGLPLDAERFLDLDHLLGLRLGPGWQFIMIEKSLKIRPKIAQDSRLNDVSKEARPINL